MHYISSNYDGTAEPTYPMTNADSFLNITLTNSNPIIINHSASEPNKGRGGNKDIVIRDNTGVKMSGLEMNPNSISYSTYDESGNRTMTYNLNTMRFEGTSSQTFKSMWDNAITEAADYIETNKLSAAANSSVTLHFANASEYHGAILLKYTDSYWSIFLFSYTGRYGICSRRYNTKTVIIPGYWA